MNTEANNCIFTSLTNPKNNLETVENKIHSITTEVQKGNYKNAAALSKTILQSGYPHIRVIVFYLYCGTDCFTQSGMSEMLAILVRVFTDFHGALLPEDDTGAEINSSMEWLFKTIGRRLEFLEKTGKQTWFDWIGGFDEESTALLVGQLRELRSLLETHISDTDFSAEGYIAGFQTSIADIPINRSPADQEDLPAVISDPPEETSPQAKEISPETEGVSEVFEESHLMTRLIQKINMFVYLAEKGEYLKASIVRADLEYLIETFDPKKYLPWLFKPFLTTLLLHSAGLKRAETEYESERLQIGSELYQMDSSMFMDLDI